VKVPGGFTSASYASRLLDEAIVVSPGTAFGDAGEGFVRVSLVPTLQDIEEAIERWRTVR
jgi:aspartate/methionine/tyrosine aminotransferase